MKVKYASLDLELSEHFRLALAGFPLPVDIRRLAQMREVLQRPVEMDGETPTYYMYRGVASEKERATYKHKSMRFDITVVPSMMLGDEYNKTYGHYHPEASNGLSFPEIYEVIEGEAHYLLQERGKTDSEAKRVYLVHAKAGEKVLIPPNFGHITINKGPSTLVMANITEGTFKSDYAPYKKCRGGAYYIAKAGKGEAEKNPLYSSAGKLAKISASEFNDKVSKKLAASLKSAEMYSLFVKNPGMFDFLVRPELVKV